MGSKKDKNVKKQFKAFDLLEFEKKEEYLSEMHKQGWRLKGFTKMDAFIFEKCEPREYIYQIDYNENPGNMKLGYYKLFEDCGWEFVVREDNDNYFRKPKSEAGENEEIFSDNESKLRRAKAVTKKAVFLGLFYIISPVLLLISTFNWDDVWGVVAYYCLISFDLIEILFVIFRYFRYKKKIEDNSK